MLSAVVACGPGFQAIYDGNARFEHCYAMEEKPQVAMLDKASCWRDWSEHYTYGQTRDRVRYATARYVALSQAPNLPTDEALMMAAPGEARASTITAPAPTNAFAPPPRVLDVNETPPAPKEPPRPLAVAAPVVDAGPPPSSLPGTSCTDTCASTFHGCHGGCELGGVTADAKSKACAACQTSYGNCMRGCFK